MERVSPPIPWHPRVFLRILNGSFDVSNIEIASPFFVDRIELDFDTHIQRYYYHAHHIIYYVLR